MNMLFNINMNNAEDKEIFKDNPEKTKEDELLFQRQTVVSQLNDYFKVPIHYNEHKVEVDKTMIQDLELVDAVVVSDTNTNTKDKTIVEKETNKSVYDYVFNHHTNDNICAKEITKQIAQNHTTDKEFLKEYQKLITNFRSLSSKKDSTDTEVIDIYDMISIWYDIKYDTGFKEKYGYIEWSFMNFLNQSDAFLLFMGLYNIVSPVLSLLIPVFCLILPFIIIRMKGLDVSVNQYVETLKLIIANHSVGKLFTDFSTVGMDQKIYIMASCGLYFLSIYQNILSCIRFHYNMKKIHGYVKDIKAYLEHTVDTMNNYLSYTEDFKTVGHKRFHEETVKHKEKLVELLHKLEMISEYKFSLRKMFEIGKIMCSFYEIYENKEYNTAVYYSFGFHGYVDCIAGLSENVVSGQMNTTQFVNKKKSGKNEKNGKDKKNGNNKDEKKGKKDKTLTTMEIKQNYYAVLKDKTPVKNDVDLENNIIITGPNASGKTTVLKSVLINILLSQQFGCGFFTDAKLPTYRHLHCYLNIPDTSGRDSLFQAEARRCKEIIDSIEEDNKSLHFCVFDEIYSGTNPEEAEKTAYAFMKYLVKRSQVSCILTTHFIKVCKRLDTNENIENYHMITKTLNDETNSKLRKRVLPTFLMKSGISSVKGGVSVLYDMDYPEEIMNNTQEE
jgi:DNA mismatch repair ATPase MutS